MNYFYYCYSMDIDREWALEPVRLRLCSQGWPQSVVHI